ncbi:MAG: hypothetical protein IPI73_02460 [Betaproteobacteria bacterium]|nr:hypothetical protein [Betaproteobacteria bacterium]
MERSDTHRKGENDRSRQGHSQSPNDEEAVPDDSAASVVGSGPIQRLKKKGKLRMDLDTARRPVIDPASGLMHC